MCDYLVVLIVLSICCVVEFKCEIIECRQDPDYDPKNENVLGDQFTWLGVLQYIHIKKGNPHYFKVPRVVLISPQYVMCTAADAGIVPAGYALGNVVFGDYERDEAECAIANEDFKEGSECDPAVMLMPIADVLLHPEYKHFGIKQSIALLKLLIEIKSAYMVPICLPQATTNHLYEESNFTIKNPLRSFWHIDFESEAPRDFTEEDKKVSKMNFLPSGHCLKKHNEVISLRRSIKIHQNAKGNSTLSSDRRTACTTGCGLHSGAPTIFHEKTGHWSILTLAMGGPTCPDPLYNNPVEPPKHILIQPYVNWIISAISGKIVTSFSKDDPFGFATPAPRAARRWGDRARYGRKGWVGHWWLSSDRCYHRGDQAADMYRFYYDFFKSNPIRLPSAVNYKLEIIAPPLTKIVCIKIGFPQIAKNDPNVTGILTSTAVIELPSLKYFVSYRIVVEAWGVKSTT